MPYPPPSAIRTARIDGRRTLLLENVWRRSSNGRRGAHVQESARGDAAVAPRAGHPPSHLRPIPARPRRRTGRARRRCSRSSSGGATQSWPIGSAISTGTTLNAPAISSRRASRPRPPPESAHSTIRTLASLCSSRRAADHLRRSWPNRAITAGRRSATQRSCGRTCGVCPMVRPSLLMGRTWAICFQTAKATGQHSLQTRAPRRARARAPAPLTRVRSCARARCIRYCINLVCIAGNPAK